MSLGQTLSGFWHHIQAGLFPWLEEELGPLGERYRRFVTVLELARVESFLPHFHGLPGRPVEDRAALARAFIAKAAWSLVRYYWSASGSGVDRFLSCITSVPTFSKLVRLTD